MKNGYSTVFCVSFCRDENGKRGYKGIQKDTLKIGFFGSVLE
jgi:hypothetical protein